MIFQERPLTLAERFSKSTSFASSVATRRRSIRHEQALPTAGFGTKQTCAASDAMSEFGGEADVSLTSRDFRF
jgi:hypothetical protein